MEAEYVVIKSRESGPIQFDSPGPWKWCCFRPGPGRLEGGAGKERPMKYILITLLIAAAVTVIVGLRRALRMYLKFRGKRLVSCPETHQPAAVRVAAKKAALKATLGNEQLRLSECSRWPEKEACGQECLAQIQEAPKACLVWTIINRWYQGQDCVYCHKPFGEIHWHDHPPALLDSDRRTVEWDKIPAERLQEVLGTHWPVCWDCHIAQTFRREHSELVVDRPESHLRMSVLK